MCKYASLFVVCFAVFTTSAFAQKNFRVYYHFENKNGNMIDDARGRHHHAVIRKDKHAPTTRKGQGLFFNGSKGQRIDIPVSWESLFESPRGFTLECIAKLSYQTENRKWVCLFGDGWVKNKKSKHIFVGKDKNTDHLRINPRGLGATQERQNLSPQWDAQWHHVALAYNPQSKQLSLYWDSQVVYQEKVNTNLINAVGKVQIGNNRHTGYKETWQGLIHSVRISKWQVKPEYFMKRVSLKSTETITASAPARPVTTAPAKTVETKQTAVTHNAPPSVAQPGSSTPSSTPATQAKAKSFPWVFTINMIISLVVVIMLINANLQRRYHHRFIYFLKRKHLKKKAQAAQAKVKARPRKPVSRPQ